MSIKKIIFPLIIVFIVLLTMASLYSFHLGFGFMLSTIILGLLFFYNIKLGFIAFFIILGLFFYVKVFPKDKEIQNNTADKKEKKYNIIKEPDNLEHEYDYKGDYELEYSFINTDIEYPVVEAMSNKKRNSGIDMISAETTMRAKESNTLPISGAFGLNKEPISVGDEGTISGYELIQE